MRVDKWLWAVRFFKTRSLAAQAVSGGKVHCNGDRVKPARMIKPGDQLTIHKDMYEWVVRVEGLSPRRLPAPDARKLYTETEESIAAREQRQQQNRLENALRAKPLHRPNKRERRQLVALKTRQE